MQVQNTAQRTKNTAHLTKADIRFIKLVRQLTPEKRAILLAAVRLMAEGQNGTPLLAPSQRAHALETFLPELERLRAAPDSNPEILQAVEEEVAKAKGRQLESMATGATQGGKS